MKKLIIILVLAFILIGCVKPIDQYDVNTELDTIHITEAGEITSLNLDIFKNRYSFNRIEFTSSNTDVMRINYKEELVSLRAGKARIKASLFDDNDLLCVVNLGTYFVIDLDSSDFMPIKSINDLQKIKANGLYYLDSNLEIAEPIKQIGLFQGILLNPNSYEIKSLISNGKESTAMFKTINEAYIDGLIFSNINIKDQPINLNILADSINNSHISNIEINGILKNGYQISPLSRIATNSTIDNVSFNGEISGGKLMGGLIGILRDSNVTNISIDATFNTLEDNTCEIGGVAAYIEGGKISDSIVRANINAKNGDITSVVANARNKIYYLENISYFNSSYPVYDEKLCINPIVTILPN